MRERRAWEGRFFAGFLGFFVVIPTSTIVLSCVCM